MKRTLRVKLLPEHAAAAALLETLHRCNKAANLLSTHARATRRHRQYDLHYDMYRKIRSETDLASQPTIRVISKVADAYSTLNAQVRSGMYGRTGSPRRARIEAKPIKFQPTSAQAFDDRCLSWNHTKQTISILTTAGRIKGIPFAGKPDDLALIATHRRGETDLTFQDGNFYLSATVDIDPVPLNVAPRGFIGVDMGIVNIATTSDGDNWSGGAVTARRKKNNRLRARLQTKGTKSAKRLLKMRSRRESRFVTDVNHRISKKIMAEAKRTGRGIAIEDLTGIRTRVRLRKPQRATLHSWAFAQLGAFLAYKAEAAGIPFVRVDPAYSSQECSACGHTEKKNRASQATFTCVSCGVSLHADENAGKVLSKRGDLVWAAINRPYAA